MNNFPKTAEALDWYFSPETEALYDQLSTEELQYRARQALSDTRYEDAEVNQKARFAFIAASNALLRRGALV